MELKEKIVLVGKSSSGKDYLAKWLKSQGLRKSVMHTTRPIREGEVNGETYHFISNESFTEMIHRDEFYEFDNFIGWYYGSTNEDFKQNQVFIKTPNGVSKIEPEDRKNCFIIYLDMPDEVLYERLLKRGDNNDSIERRMDADREDFKNFTDYDLRICDRDYDPEFILSLLKY